MGLIAPMDKATTEAFVNRDGHLAGGGRGACRRI